MKTYPEMDKEIVKLLDIEGTPFSVYDARCIEKLQAENAELRARLDKAIELPRIVHPNAYEWFVQYQNEYGLIFDEILYSERAAEARLKELKEKKTMTEREKIVKIIAPYVAAYGDDERIADALIAAGIGDKSGYRLFISKDGTEIKQLYSCEEVEQIANERDEYKHRAKVAGRALLRLCDETMRDIRIIMYPNIGKQVRDKQELYDYCIEQAENELTEEGKDG